VLSDPEVGSVFVLTRHDSHARYAIKALRAGKHVFVEKPLALSDADLDAIAEAAVAADRLVMVGFNRRFAPLTVELQKHLRGRAGPLSVIATINAGAIPREHWTQDWSTSGGRIAGEACHWIDLSRALVGAPIADLTATTARNSADQPIDDIAHLTLRFSDGSTAAVHYLASGARSFPKERIECFFDGKTLVIENWRRLRRYGVPRPLIELGGKVEKGHAAEITRWMSAVRGEADAPIPLAELLEVSRWSLRAAALARGGRVGPDPA
jgi:predicted dehydrogenase